MSSRAVVLGTTQDNDIDAFMKHVRMIPNFIDIEVGKDDIYGMFLDHPEWLCTVKGAPDVCHIHGGGSHQFIMTGLDDTARDVKDVMEECDTKFRREHFNLFGIGHSPNAIQACFDACDDLTLDISVVQEYYWPDRRRCVEQMILPITKDRRVRIEAMVDAGWKQDRILGLTWLSRHSMLQILPWVGSKDAIIMNSSDMDRDLLSCLCGRPLASSELQKLEKNNDCIPLYDEEIQLSE